MFVLPLSMVKLTGLSSLSSHPPHSLVIQSILPVKNALESKHALIWIWGKPATGDLKRPFKAPAGPFGEY